MRGVSLICGFTRKFSARLKGPINTDRLRVFTTFVLVLRIFSAFFFSSVFAQDAFVHTTRQDFELGILQKIDTTSSPGDVKLALKSKPFWWDEEYSGRFQIRIENNEGRQLPPNYTISLSIDHASWVSGGRSLETGDDVRVVYGPPTEEPIELDRILEESSLWNSPSTTILFKTQAPILTESSDYYLYFGNREAKDPPSNPSNVYAFFESFEDALVQEKPVGWDKTDWAVDFEVSDEESFSGDKSLKLSGEASNVAVYTHSPVGLDYTAKVRFLADEGKNGGIYFRSFDDKDPDFQKAPFNNRPYPHFIFAANLYQLNSGRAGGHLWDSCPPSECPPPKQGEWNTFEVKVVRRKVLKVLANGVSIWWKNQSLPIELPTDKGTRTGVVFMGQLIFYDDFSLKLAIENEPSASLIEEVDEYEAEGSLESAPFDVGKKVSWDKIDWQATTLFDTDLVFQVATSDDGKTWSDWSKVLTVSGGELSFLEKSRFIKYKAILATADPLVTPLLHEVRIGVANTPPTITSLRLISSDDPFAFETSILRVQVETFDEENDEVTLFFIWYKNGQRIVGAPSSSQLTGEYFAKHDEISVLATPNDGKIDGKSWQSGPIFIENSPPAVCELVSPKDDSMINVNPPVLIWEASSDLDFDTMMYQVELDGFPDFSSPGKLVSNLSTTSYTPSLSLSEGEYFWKVKANDGEAESSWSEVFSFILDVTASTTSFTKKPESSTNKTTVDFEWEGEDNFTLKENLVYSSRLNEGLWSDFSVLTTAKFSNLTDGVYTFEIKAKDLARNIEESALYSFSVDTTPPSLPSNFSAEALDGQIKLSWSQILDSDLSGYNLYRSLYDNQGFEKLNPSLLFDTNYTDTSLANGIKYYYKITSVDNLENESEFSSAVGVTPRSFVTTTSTTATATFSSPAPLSSLLSPPPSIKSSFALSPALPLPSPQVLGIEAPHEGKTFAGAQASSLFGGLEILLKLVGAILVVTFIGASGYLTAQFRRS